MERSPEAVALVFALHWLTGGIGICMGFHRQLTHTSFVTYKWLRYSLAFLGAWQTFDLSLYGFEQSLAITIDSGNQSWSSITDVYDLAGSLIRRDTLDHAGARSDHV